ncbi:TPR-like protein [Coemansia reversa NRRL 1564]|uniref:TPR-like protein n=1 Tax=Coemansia reversa (strain ATCC 12441 / NRRL 1564) TaxID=763665 RepID=A0A2G5BFK3_COERN|nr:TPR-like protein [Coemansia reversa NRRL 1564]|eukprot:PIA17784.1 TPR-like protein [Coemansia reversa NRRL 1564]
MSDRKALELLQNADKKAQQKGWFSGPKYDEAGELYEQASNQFKLARQMREAGDAMLKAAQMSLKLGEGDDAAQRFISASKAFKKTHPKQAVDALSQAVVLLTERGRFHAAASHQKEVAKVCEEELSDLKRAIDAYQLAADWYMSEDSSALANGCLLKVASLSAQLEKYDRAIEIFETIAEGSLDNQLTKWSVKDYFLKAALCRLAIPDDIGAAEALAHYQDLDPTFSGSRECSFLAEIVSDAKKNDLQAFTDHVASYDRLSKLDNWKTTLLLRIKRQILEADEDLT